MVSRMTLSMIHLCARVRTAVPSQGPAQSLFERELRIMPEVAPRSIRISLGIADVAFARWKIARRQRDSFDFLQQLPYLIQRVPSAIAGIVHFAAHTGRRRCFQTQTSY